MRFNYIDFLNYYMNPDNLLVDNSSMQKVYFFMGSNVKPNVSTISNNYIIVNEQRVYVTPIIKNRNGNKYIKCILFTIPTEIRGKLYEFHYNVGEKEESLERLKIVEQYKTKPRKAKTIRSSRSSIRNKKQSIVVLDNIDIDISDNDSDTSLGNEIYFHKTIQNVNDDGTGTNEHINCHFKNNTKINDIENIICYNTIGATMKMQFLSDEIKQIREILTRPFRKNGTGGKKQTRKRN